VADGVHATVTGADRVASTMKAAGRDIGDLTDANKAAGDIIAAGARVIAPRLTGALARATQGAGERDAAGITNMEPYFGPIHYGWPAHNIAAQPFVDTALVQTQDQWLAVYTKAAEHAADQVKGA
jgi:hypothetical protein